MKSTHSNGNGQCIDVEFDVSSGLTLVTDTKYLQRDEPSPEVICPIADWLVFLDWVCRGDFSSKFEAISGFRVVVYGDGTAEISDNEVTHEFNTGEWEAFRRGVMDGQLRPPSSTTPDHQ